jgi:hypothetical protein
MSKSIDEIMCKFDFEKVRKCMVAVNWHWANVSQPDHIPSIAQLKEEARRLLIMALNNNQKWANVQCGGFCAVKDDDGLGLSFILEQA